METPLAIITPKLELEDLVTTLKTEEVCSEQIKEEGNSEVKMEAPFPIITPKLEVEDLVTAIKTEEEIKTEDDLEVKTIVPLVQKIKSEPDIKYLVATLKTKEEFSNKIKEEDGFEVKSVKIINETDIKTLVATLKVKQEDICKTELDDYMIKDLVPIIQIKRDPEIEELASSQENKQRNSFFERRYKQANSENVCMSDENNSAVKCIHNKAEPLFCEDKRPNNELKRCEDVNAIKNETQMTEQETNNTSLKDKFWAAESGQKYNIYSQMHCSICQVRKQYKCDICEKLFSLKGNLIKHKLKHRDVKTYKCDVCNKLFNSKGNFTKHKFIHADVKLFKCDVCDKLFSLKSYLTKHKLTHRDVKPYKCGKCEKTFCFRNNLTQHLITHTGDRKYTCNVCKRTYVSKSSLRVHKVLHFQPCKCDVCGKSFCDKFYLSRHRRVHTGDKPFKCDICENKFSYKSSLIRHIVVHTADKDKPYKCVVCDKGFFRKHHLFNHSKLHTCYK